MYVNDEFIAADSTCRRVTTLRFESILSSSGAVSFASDLPQDRTEDVGPSALQGLAMVSGGELKHVAKRPQKGKYLRFGLVQYLFTFKWQRRWIPSSREWTSSPLSLETPNGVLKSSRFSLAMVASSRDRISAAVLQAVDTVPEPPPRTVTLPTHISQWKPTRSTLWQTPRFLPGELPILARELGHQS